MIQHFNLNHFRGDSSLYLKYFESVKIGRSVRPWQPQNASPWCQNDPPTWVTLENHSTQTKSDTKFLFASVYGRFSVLLPVFWVRDDRTQRSAVKPGTVTATPAVHLRPNAASDRHALKRQNGQLFNGYRIIPIWLPYVHKCPADSTCNSRSRKIQFDFTD